MRLPQQLARRHIPPPPVWTSCRIQAGSTLASAATPRINVRAKPTPWPSWSTLPRTQRTRGRSDASRYLPAHGRPSCAQTADRAMLMRGTEGEIYANPRRCPEMKVVDGGPGRCPTGRRPPSPRGRGCALGGGQRCVDPRHARGRGPRAGADPRQRSPRSSVARPGRIPDFHRSPGHRTSRYGRGQAARRRGLKTP